MITIRARNNLDIPARLTITVVGNDEILITIGKEGTALRTFYGVCIDRDLAPGKEWDSVGRLGIESNYRISVKGEESEREKES